MRIVVKDLEGYFLFVLNLGKRLFVFLFLHPPENLQFGPVEVNRLCETQAFKLVTSLSPLLNIVIKVPSQEDCLARSVGVLSLLEF